MSVLISDSDTDEVGILLDLEHLEQRPAPPEQGLSWKTHQLRAVPEFRDLRDYALSRLASAAEPKRLIQGQTVWDEHQHASECAVVVEGRLMSMRLGSKPYPVGSLVGHLPLLATEPDNEPRRPATVVATVRSLALLIPYSALSEVLDQLVFPDNTREMARLVCGSTHSWR